MKKKRWKAEAQDWADAYWQSTDDRYMLIQQLEAEVILREHAEAEAQAARLQRQFPASEIRVTDGGNILLQTAPTSKRGWWFFRG